MADWKNKLDFSDFWDKDIPIFEKAASACDKVFELKEKIKKQLDAGSDSYNFYDLETLENIGNDFSYGETVEDFDWTMQDLYNWGDEVTDDNKGAWPAKKKCWIATM